MGREIAKAYEPQQIEPRWADFWVKEELFKADANAPGPVFSIVIPPPNLTGSLHIGHMLDHTEIDVLTRWHRMRGYNTLYLSGTDHDSISTQRVVVKQLADQGINYRDLGREEFLKRVWKWKEESGGIITRQMKQIGESCDWSREKFTLSPELSAVVTEVFVRLYEEGLIYRENRLLNWCPVCLTVLSDLEVLHEERQGHLWYIKYPVAGTKDFMVVATTRPGTMLGDTAAAADPRGGGGAHLAGKGGGGAGNCGGGTRRDPHHSRQPARGIFQLDAKHPRLDAVAATLVGPPDSGVALRRLQGNHRGARGAHEVHKMRIGKAATGSGRAGHVV